MSRWRCDQLKMDLRWSVMLLALFFAMASWFFPRSACADECSPYIGDMTINEIYELGNEAWVETRLLDTALSSTVYDQWSIRLCDGGSCRTYPVSGGQVLYSEAYPSWITLTVDKSYVDLLINGGMDLVLRDENGLTVDYLSVNNYDAHRPDCSSFLYPTETGSLTSSQKGIFREPDGTGPWMELEGSGATGEPTRGFDNDDQQLVAHYALEGNADDSSINGLDGSSQGSVTYQRAVICDGVQLDGTGYLQVPDNDLLDMRDALTVMAWIHPDSLGVSGHDNLYSLLSKDENYEFHVQSDGSLYWWWGAGSFSTGSGEIVAGEWTHVAFVYSRTDGIMRIFVNGQQVASYAYSDSLTVNGNPFLIGADIATGGSELTGRRFYGSIDEVRLYNTALSSAEISDLMNATDPCALPTPLAEWRFDECGYDGVAALAEDAQGNYDLTAQGDVESEAAGVVGRAAVLDDSSDHFLAGADVPLNDAWTVSTWFRLPYSAEEGSRYHVLGSMAGGGDLMWVDDQTGQWGVWDGSSDATGSFLFSSLTTGWHHMVLTGTTERVWSWGWGWTWRDRTVLYIDGARVDAVNLRSNGDLHYVGTSYDTYGGNQGFRAALDEYLVFDQALDEDNVLELYQLQSEGRNLDGTLREEILCGPGIDHFEIIHDGSALTCAPESVTVRACADDADPCALYAGDVEVTLSPSGWIDGDTQTLSGGIGVFHLRHTTAETVTLSVTGDPAAEQALQCSDGSGGSSCDLTFYESGFLFELPNLESCQTSSTVAIQAVRMDDDTQACIGDDSFAGTTRQVSFTSSYVSAKTGSLPVSVKGNADAAFADLPAVAQLNFDATASGSFTFSYDDAGSVTLSASFTGSGDEAGLQMSGSDTFVAYPNHLQVIAANPDDATLLNNTTSSGDPHWPAGEDFALEVTGVCADNSETPSFAWQTDLNVLDYLPLGGQAGNFTPASLAAADYTDGVAESTASYSEVGIVTLQAQASDYLEPGIDVTGAGTIGRFTPYQFALSWYQNPELVPGCALGGFTYVGQSFGYNAAPVVKVTALNKEGGITANYTDSDWWKITQATLLSGRSYSASEGTLEFSGGGVSISYPVEEDGSGTLTYDAVSEMKFFRGAPTAPFDADIDLEVNVADDDGISAPGPLSFTDIPFAGEASGMNADEMRWGRMVLHNAYGSELTPLAMPLRAEYYNGSSFVTNADDHCTSVSAAQLSQTGTVTSSATLNSPLSAGDAGLVFSAPNATGYIDVQLDLSAMPWLRYDWDGDGSNDDDPSARASFGLYEGSPAMIYLRESFR